MIVTRPLIHLASFSNSIRQIMASSGANTDPYASNSFVGHSLWLCPSGKSKEAYQGIIQQTSNELNTFCFTPHITLVAAMMENEQQVVAKAKQLASLLDPYEFEFDTLSQRNAYFQCVFAKFKTTHQVLHANQVARSVFTERQSDPPYMPHLSLLYGDFSPSDKESTIIPNLQQAIQANEPYTTKFTVDSIEVWSTKGHVQDWYLVETVPFQSKHSNK